MILDDPGGESLTLGVQVDSGREWTGDQWRLIESRVYCAAYLNAICGDMGIRGALTLCPKDACYSPVTADSVSGSALR